MTFFNKQDKRMRFQLLEDVQTATQMIKFTSAAEDTKSFLKAKQQNKKGYKQCLYKNKQNKSSETLTYKLP